MAWDRELPGGRARQREVEGDVSRGSSACSPIPPLASVHRNPLDAFRQKKELRHTGNGVHAFPRQPQMTSRGHCDPEGSKTRGMCEMVTKDRRVALLCGWGGTGGKYRGEAGGEPWQLPGLRMLSTGQTQRVRAPACHSPSLSWEGHKSAGELLAQEVRVSEPWQDWPGLGERPLSPSHISSPDESRGGQREWVALEAYSKDGREVHAHLCTFMTSSRST